MRSSSFSKQQILQWHQSFCSRAVVLHLFVSISSFDVLVFRTRPIISHSSRLNASLHASQRRQDTCAGCRSPPSRYCWGCSILHYSGFHCCCRAEESSTFCFFWPGHIAPAAGNTGYDWNLKLMRDNWNIRTGVHSMISFQIIWVYLILILLSCLLVNKIARVCQI